MQVPVSITFRGLAHSDAVKTHIEEKIEKLHQYNDHITSCHVVIEFENKNQHRGNLHNTRITLTVPGKELVTTRNEEEDMYISIRTAFEDMTRQLEEYMRQLHNGKHEPIMMAGKIARLFTSDGFGFIESEDGSEFYFNANHIAHTEFHKLNVGMPVHFVREEGNNGPEARRVKLMHDAQN